MKPLVIRQLDVLSEFKEAVRLQKEIWGFEDIELLPVRLFVVAKKVGGQAIGAFRKARQYDPGDGSLDAVLEPRALDARDEDDGEELVLAAGPGGSELFILSPDSGAKPGQRIR